MHKYVRKQFFSFFFGDFEASLGLPKIPKVNLGTTLEHARTWEPSFGKKSAVQLVIFLSHMGYGRKVIDVPRPDEIVFEKRS